MKDRVQEGKKARRQERSRKEGKQESGKARKNASKKARKDKGKKGVSRKEGSKEGSMGGCRVDERGAQVRLVWALQKNVHCPKNRGGVRRVRPPPLDPRLGRKERFVFIGG